MVKEISSITGKLNNLLPAMTAMATEYNKAYDEDILHWEDYDYVLINEDLVTCTNEVVTILKAERKKRDRQKFLLDVHHLSIDISKR